MAEAEKDEKPPEPAKDEPVLLGEGDTGKPEAYPGFNN